MLKKWNRVLAILLAFALVTTTFGSDLASTRAFAVENEEELAQLENDDIQTADWEQIPQEENQPEDPVEEQPQEEQEVTDAQPEENAEVTDEANQDSGAAGDDAAATETTETINKTLYICWIKFSKNLKELCTLVIRKTQMQILR